MRFLSLAVLAYSAVSLNAMADDGLCKPLAGLAKLSAEQRDKGVSQEDLMRSLARQGALDPKDPSAPFAVNTIMWVYEERISAATAYRDMLAKCTKAVGKQRK